MLLGNLMTFFLSIGAPDPPHCERPPSACLGAAASLMGYHWILIRDRSREGCFKAFMHNNWVGAAIFVGVVLSTTFRESR